MASMYNRPMYTEVPLSAIYFHHIPYALRKSRNYNVNRQALLQERCSTAQRTRPGAHWVQTYEESVSLPFNTEPKK